MMNDEKKAKNIRENSKQKQLASGGVFFRFGHLYFCHLNLFRVSNFGFRIYYLHPIIDA